MPSITCPRTACNGVRMKSGSGSGQSRTGQTGNKSGEVSRGANGQRGADDIKVVGPGRRDGSAQSCAPETCQADDAKKLPGEGHAHLLAGVSEVRKHVCRKHVKKVARIRVRTPLGRRERSAACVQKTCQADDAKILAGEGVEKKELAGVCGVQKHVCTKHVKLTTQIVARREATTSRRVGARRLPNHRRSGGVSR